MEMQDLISWNNVAVEQLARDPQVVAPGQEPEGSHKALQLFTGCLQVVKSHFQQQVSSQRGPCGGKYQAPLSLSDSGTFPSVGLTSLASLFDRSLGGIDTRYFVYTNSIKFNVNDELSSANTGSPDVAPTLAIVLFNIAQVYHIRGLQQDAAAEAEAMNLAKAGQMYTLALELILTMAQDFVTSPVTAASARTLVHGPLLVAIGALNNLATLQLKLGNANEARDSLHHLLGLLSTLSQNVSNPHELSGLNSAEWNSMMGNCVLVLLHHHISEHCDNAPAA